MIVSKAAARRSLHVCSTPTSNGPSCLLMQCVQLETSTGALVQLTGSDDVSSACGQLMQVFVIGAGLKCLIVNTIPAVE